MTTPSDGQDTTPEETKNPDEAQNRLDYSNASDDADGMNGEQ